MFLARPLFSQPVACLAVGFVAAALVGAHAGAALLTAIAILLLLLAHARAAGPAFAVEAFAAEAFALAALLAALAALLVLLEADVITLLRLEAGAAHAALLA